MMGKITGIWTVFAMMMLSVASVHAQTVGSSLPDVPWETIEETGNQLLNKQSEISSDELIELLLNSPEKVFVVDLRDSIDAAGSYIPGSVVLPYEKIYSAEIINKLPDDRLIVAYCYRAQRSAKAWFAWKLAGKEVKSLMGGFGAWSYRAADHPEFEKLIESSR